MKLRAKAAVRDLLGDPPPKRRRGRVARDLRLAELKLLGLRGEDVGDLDLKRRTLLVRPKRLERLERMRAHKSRDP